MKESAFPIEKEEMSVLLVDHPFKLKLKERFFLMLLVYYFRLYITFTLSGFLFDLDQSNVYRDIISILEPLIKLSVCSIAKEVV
jgi:hypothetical protein